MSDHYWPDPAEPSRKKPNYAHFPDDAKMCWRHRFKLFRAGHKVNARPVFDEAFNCPRCRKRLTRR